MKKIIVDRQYQLPEFPSVPYTPPNFWNTMHAIPGIEAIVGTEPTSPKKPTGYREDYQGTFYSHKSGITIHYNFDGVDQEATVTLYGPSKSIDVMETLIRNEHRNMKKVA